MKQAAYGETRAAIIKKKLMKNKIKVEAATPANADQQSSIKTDTRAKINTARRQANRALNTDRLLALLRRETPKFFELAEVVGKWVWIQFDGKQPVTITSVLSELGFHWNNTRQAWQLRAARLPTSGRTTTRASVTAVTSPRTGLQRDCQ